MLSNKLNVFKSSRMVLKSIAKVVQAASFTDILYKVRISSLRPHLIVVLL